MGLSESAGTQQLLSGCTFHPAEIILGSPDPEKAGVFVGGSKMVNGFALIECRKGRRAGEKGAIDKWIADLRRANRKEGWPKRAKLGIVEEITRLYGEEHGVRANARVVVEAPTKRELLDTFGFFERNFSHVEGYGL